ncbi:MAG: hypothetical protein M3464_15565 [Chloroflexota bacterium]|nr:hypothetical protein [Chloroflexota bacterium]
MPDFEHLARRFAQTNHRRGVLAALAGLLTLPLTTRAQAIPGTCSPRGGGCTLLIPCCGRVRCIQTSPYNPNSGVCGGVLRDTSSGPAFISPTSGGGGSVPTNRGGSVLSEAALVDRYDRNGDGILTCADFDTQAEAQAAYDDNPNDPFGLDGPPGTGRAGAGEFGRPCEDLP